MYRVAAFSESQPVNLNYVKDQLLNGKPLIPTDLKPSWKGQTITQPALVRGKSVVRYEYAGTTGLPIQPSGIINEPGPNYKTKSSGWISGTTATNSRPLNNLSVADTKSNWNGLSIVDIHNPRSLQRYTCLLYTSPSPRD